MFDVLVQMTGLILCGIGWRIVKPGGLEPQETRKVLTSLVYYLLLPALVLSVLWTAELGSSSVLISISAIFGILLGLFLGMLSCRVCNSRPAVTGAVILAAAFPNITYLGLPVLEAAFGPWSRSVAIQYDLFAATPLLFTVGVLVAAHFGSRGEGGPAKMVRDIAQIPALWAALVAVSLNVGDVQVPNIIGGLLSLLERGVVPLMLISLGLSLKWDRSQWKTLPSVIPVALISLLIVPAAMMPFTSMIGLGGEVRTAVILEGAMPSMVLGIVLCDRFDLDVSLYATAVTVTTALSLITLPMWFQWLT